MSRTLHDILIKTISLHIGVFASYGHLGSLQGVSADSPTALSRLLFLFLDPIAIVFESIFHYVMFTYLILRTLYLRSAQHRLFSWKLILLSLAGAPLPPSDKTLSFRKALYFGAPSLDGRKIKPLEDVSPAKYMGPEPHDPKTSPKARLGLIGRMVVILATLAQAIASTFLLVRRFRQPEATMSIDIRAFFLSIIGIFTALNSLVILLVTGGEGITLVELRRLQYYNSDTTDLINSTIWRPSYSFFFSNAYVSNADGRVIGYTDSLPTYFFPGRPWLFNAISLAVFESINIRLSGGYSNIFTLPRLPSYLIMGLLPLGSRLGINMMCSSLVMLSVGILTEEINHIKAGGSLLWKQANWTWNDSLSDSLLVY